MNRERVGIIGLGKLGMWLFDFLKKSGYTPIGSDMKTAMTNEQVIARSDVIFLATPISTAVTLSRKLAPRLKKDQLVVYMTSVRDRIAKELLGSKAEVAGMHVMCRPLRNSEGEAVSLAGENVVASFDRIECHREWFEALLASTEASIAIAKLYQHDGAAGITQLIEQQQHLILATLIRQTGIPLSTIKSYATPLFRKTLEVIERLLQNDPDLCFDIQHYNGCGRGLREMLITKAVRFNEGIIAGDRESFRREFVANQKYFGGK